MQKGCLGQLWRKEKPEMTDTYYRGRVAVITGAGGTLCSEIAVDLAQKGANVVLIGRSADKLQKTELKIKAFSGSSMVRPLSLIHI